MTTPARYPNGLTNVAKSSAMGMYGAPDPTKYHTFFDDFDRYVAGDWTLTSIGVTGTAALTDVDGGCLLLTDTAADNDGTQLQKVGEGFLLEAGKRAWFKARFKVSDATQSDFIIGLAVSDTTLLGAVNGAGVTDGIFFSKDDGDALLDFQVQNTATTGQIRVAGIATVVANTFVTVGWYYNGKDEVKYFVDDVHIGTLSGETAYLPDTELTVSFGLLNGEGAAKTMTVDYLFASKSR